MYRQTVKFSNLCRPIFSEILVYDPCLYIFIGRANFLSSNMEDASLFRAKFLAEQLFSDFADVVIYIL